MSTLVLTMKWFLTSKDTLEMLGPLRPWLGQPPRPRLLPGKRNATSGACRPRGCVGEPAGWGAARSMAPGPCAQPAGAPRGHPSPRPF